MKKKQWVLLSLVILLLLAVWILRAEPQIAEGTENTQTVTVTDRAMSDNLPYLGVRLHDGTGLCLWDIRDTIPDDVQIGDTVTVTYGRMDGAERYILLSIKK